MWSWYTNYRNYKIILRAKINKVFTERRFFAPKNYSKSFFLEYIYYTTPVVPCILCKNIDLEYKKFPRTICSWELLYKTNKTGLIFDKRIILLHVIMGINLRCWRIIRLFCKLYSSIDFFLYLLFDGCYFFFCSIFVF